MRYFLLFALSAFLFTFSCKSTQSHTSSNNEGSTVQDAIVVESIGQEYDYINKNCSGCQVVMQSLVFIKKKPYDILEVKKPNGEKVEYYFDISSFYGKW